ncbi:sensor histidine kinase [Hymenobacter properus]|uniref:histidine kinase n=1 Tax=Hymenobacter properus TaxID=2791026 RepID=A0A931FMN2_9BACT|nr:HAMP domain-containing sensor histidine kinase [Hymenobacter properus]MBF9144165.1 HAMP domain-containing histidine kinase [Hymenobacter properus]MBR7722981.1 HAMP domain-containing histidine kinase [Microvirga sp. SRT04]
MTIRLRLALQFGTILALTLLLFALAIYFATQESRREVFTQNLFKRTMVVGHAYVAGQNGRDNAGEEASYRNYLRQLYRTLPAEQGRVYDAQNRLVFREGQGPTRPVPVAWLAEVRRSGRAVLETETNYHETVGLLYHDDRLGPLVVVASSVDEDSRQQLRELRQLLVGGLLAAVAVMGLGSWMFAGQALWPLRRMVREVDGITATDLSQRLTRTGETTDEIGLLTQRFNRLLDRLEAAFVGQRTFVRDASHELRTPLTALIGELEVSLLQAERSPTEYRRVLQSTLDSARQLNNLTNGLLQIARASDDPSQVPMAEVRLDELLLHAHEQLLRRHSTCRVDLDFGEAENFTVRGNEALLLSAVLNVLDNACKFSQASGGTVTATLARTREHLTLLVSDEGPGLSAADLEQVFVPFFRAASARAVPGHGIGLPLTARIMALHSGMVRVESELGQGTQVWLEWPVPA